MAEIPAKMAKKYDFTIVLWRRRVKVIAASVLAILSFAFFFVHRSSVRDSDQQDVLPAYFENLEFNDDDTDASKGFSVSGPDSQAMPTISIAIISNNRFKPLVRLCESLLRADYSEASRYFTGKINLVFNLEAKSEKAIVD